MDFVSLTALNWFQVIADGRVKEIDPAHSLLQDETGLLTKQLCLLTESEQTRLTELAQDKYNNKPYVPPAQCLGGEVPLSKGGPNPKNFLPSFQTNRISSVLSNFSGSRFSTNRFWQTVVWITNGSGLHFAFGDLDLKQGWFSTIQVPSSVSNNKTV